MNPGKKPEPLALTLDQLFEEPREEISSETSVPPEPGEPVVTATDPIPDPVPEPEPSAMKPVPIPEEALKNIEGAVNQEKPNSDTAPVEKINTRTGEAVSELHSESPLPPAETGPEAIPSPQNTGSGKIQRLITRLETFQKNAEKTFASKIIAPIKNEMALSLPASTNTGNLPPQKPETKGDVFPTLTLEKLETFLFTTRQKN